MPSETPPEAAASTSDGGSLTPHQVERVSDLVYRLMRDELLRQRERRGGAAPAWR
ncbi:MAG: hypothetical protein V3R95_04860 [Dehalococcoidia bacterium]